MGMEADGLWDKEPPQTLFEMLNPQRGEHSGIGQAATGATYKQRRQETRENQKGYGQRGQQPREDQTW